MVRHLIIIFDFLLFLLLLLYNVFVLVECCTLVVIIIYCEYVSAECFYLYGSKHDCLKKSFVETVGLLGRI